jgi:hypothetical protein
MESPLHTNLSESQIPVAAEDRFVIVAVRDAPKLCPPYEAAEVFASALQQAKSFLGDIIPVFDFRGLEVFYSDVREFIAGFETRRPHVLVNKSDLGQVEAMGLREKGFKVITARGDSQSTTPLPLAEFYQVKEERRHAGSRDDPIEKLAIDLETFIALASAPSTDDGHPGQFDRMDDFLDRDAKLSRRIFDSTLPSLTHIIEDHTRDFGSITPGEIARSFHEFIPVILRDWRRRREMGNMGLLTHYLRAAYLVSFLRKIHHHSLLVEFAMVSRGGDVICLPYHGHAVHEVQMPRKADILVGRPAVLAKTTGALMTAEIRGLSMLVNNTGTREREIQTFLEQHPNFLRGLNYKNIYPQLVLQREGAGSLIPDFILEPFDGAWCDILDVKLPRQKLVIGSNDRATLAAGIHEVVAQLREYSAYFEQEKYRKYVEQRFGLRLYRPRLIALVGRDMNQMETPEFRRAMSAYDNVTILTFDDLIKHSHSRLLI